MTPISKCLLIKLRNYFFIIMLSIFFFYGGVASVFAELPADLAQGIGILSEYKSNAEQQARILVGLAAEKDITKDDYLKGQSLYAQAKAGFDGWIDQLIFEIQSCKSTVLSPQYETIQAAAKAKGDAFTQFVQEQFLGERRGEIGEEFKSTFASIKEVGQHIVTGFNEMVGGPSRAEVIHQLQEYKWEEFHNIEKSL